MATNQLDWNKFSFEQLHIYRMDLKISVEAVYSG